MKKLSYLLFLVQLMYGLPITSMVEHEVAAEPEIQKAETQQPKKSAFQTRKDESTPYKTVQVEEHVTEVPAPIYKTQTFQVEQGPSSALEELQHSIMQTNNTNQLRSILIDTMKTYQDLIAASDPEITSFKLLTTKNWDAISEQGQTTLVDLMTFLRNASKDKTMNLKDMNSDISNIVNWVLNQESKINSLDRNSQQRLYEALIDATALQQDFASGTMSPSVDAKMKQLINDMQKDKSTTVLQPKAIRVMGPEFATEESKGRAPLVAEVNKFKNKIKNASGRTELSNSLKGLMESYLDLLHFSDPKITSYDSFTNATWKSLSSRGQSTLANLFEFIRLTSENKHENISLFNNDCMDLLQWAEDQKEKAPTLTIDQQATLYRVLIDVTILEGDFSTDELSPMISNKVDVITRNLAEINNNYRTKLNNNTQLTAAEATKDSNLFLQGLKKIISVLKKKLLTAKGAIHDQLLLTYNAYVCEVVKTEALFNKVENARNVLLKPEIQDALEYTINQLIEKGDQQTAQFFITMLSGMTVIAGLPQESVTAFHAEMGKVLGRDPVEEVIQELPEDVRATLNERVGRVLMDRWKRLIDMRAKTNREDLPKNFENMIGLTTYQALNAFTEAYDYYAKASDAATDPKVRTALKNKMTDMDNLIEQINSVEFTIVLKNKYIRELLGDDKGTNAQIVAQQLKSYMPVNQIASAIDTLYGGTDMQKQLQEVLAINQRGKTIDSVQNSLLVILVIANVLAITYLLSMLLSKQKSMGQYANLVQGMMPKLK